MYRNPHRLRVVTLDSRSGTGNVLYPPEFARLASSPDPGGATEPHKPRSRESRGVSFAELCFALAIFLAIYGTVTESATWVGAGCVACVLGFVRGK